MLSPPRSVTLPLCTIDNNDSSTFTRSFRLPTLPGRKWTVLYSLPTVGFRAYAPATVKVAWSTSYAAEACSKATLCVDDEGKAYEVVIKDGEEGLLANTKAGSVVFKVGRPNGNFNVSLTVEFEPKETTAANRCLALFDGTANMDLCLSFPPSSRSLMASSTLLRQVSPWWETTLSTSGFLEGASATPRRVSRTADDSDAEDDELEEVKKEPFTRLATPPPSPPSSPPFRPTNLPPSSTVRTIPLTGTSYATYRAFLLYLLTDRLSFAPLTSTFISSSSPSLAEARTARREMLTATALLDPSAPTPISPLSLFRLAHFLEIPELMDRSLEALKGALTVNNVAYELFGDGGEQPPMGEVFERVWEVEVEFARKVIDEVKVSRGMKEARARMREEGGASVYEVETLMRLLEVEEETMGL